MTKKKDGDKTKTSPTLQFPPTAQSTMEQLSDALKRSAEEVLAEAGQEAARNAATHCVVPPPPGIYPDVPFSEYASWNAANSHILTRLTLKTPAHVHYEIMHGGAEPSRAKDLGWMTHVCVLEPERFVKEWAVPPKVDRRTTIGKATWNEFVAAHPDANHAKYEDFHGARSMRESLLAHPTAGEFFRAQGRNEVCVVWIDRETRVPCKARIDRMAPIGVYEVIADVKSAANAARRPFEKCLHDFGYGIQSVHYRDGLDTLYPIKPGDPQRRFVWLVVESSAPYLVAPYEMDPEGDELAAGLRSKALRLWKECNESGVWPGYHDGIELVTYPSWMFKGWALENGE